MAIESPPDQTPDQSTIHIAPTLPLVPSLWYTTQTISNIADNSSGYGFLLAQGWQPVGAPSLDSSTTPPTAYYTLTRQSPNTALTLQSLINSYTIAENDAKAANQVRYNEIVTNWRALSGNSQDYFDTQVDQQNAHVLLYTGNLDTYMAAVDTLIEANQSQLVTDAAVATAALTVMNDKLGDLETNAGNNAKTIGDLLTNQGGYLSTFMGNFVAKLAELDDNYAAHLLLIQTQLSTSSTDMAAFKESQATELGTLSGAYDDLVLDLEALLSTAGGNLTSISGATDAVLTSLSDDYDDVALAVTSLLTSATNAHGTYAKEYGTVLASLESDYVDHVLIARPILDGLGATELKRIDEQFAASLATQLQQLTDRGLSSSAVTADITARNTRDRNEEIAALNDRLAREKLEHQHTLYGQRVAMRTGTLGGKDRLHAVQQEVLRYQASEVTGSYQLLTAMRDRTLAGKQSVDSLRDANTRLNIDVQSRLYETGQTVKRLLIDEAARLQQLQQSVTQWTAGQRDTLLQQIQQVETQHLAGIDKQNTAQQDVSRVAMSERDQLLGQLQDAVKGFLAGKERYSAMTMQNASTLSEGRHRVIVEKMNEFATRQEGLRSTHADNMVLMQYQLSEQNQLLIGLYGFVERREDVGPRFEELARVVTALGDSGGGWITP